MDVFGCVDDLHPRLAACDTALVQGGRTTRMELTAARVPFVYFPPHNRFEQDVHGRHRIGRYGADRRLEYSTSDSDRIAAAVVEEIGRPVR
jgi:hypothetical protein